MRGWRARLSRARKSPGGALAAAVFLALAAALSPALAQPPGLAGLIEIPEPNLDHAESGVRRQLEAQRRELELLLASPGAGVAELAEAYGLLGRQYHAYDLRAAAEAGYRNALALAPREFRWHYLLGLLQRMSGELEEARASLEAALEMRAEDVPALLHLAQIELDRGAVERAESYARRALAGDPRSAMAEYVLGRAAAERRVDRAAAEHFLRVLELQPGASRVHYVLAQTYRRLGDREAAKRHLAQRGSVEVGFRDPLAEDLGRSLAGAAALMQRGAGARAAGLKDLAVESYRRAVEADPANPEARRNLGLALAEAGKIEEGIEQYREALRLEPESARTHFSLGLLLADAGRLEEALAPLAAAVELEPEYRDFRYVLASRLAAAQRFGAAAEHYRRLLERDPLDLAARLELAAVLVELGDPLAAAEAERVFAADASTSQKARAYRLLAGARSSAGRGQEAISHLQEAVALDATFAEAHFSLANLLGQSGRFAEAASHYRQVVTLDPERVPARLGEATALALAGREAEALRRLQESVDALPGQPVLAHALARLLVGAADPAVRDAQRGLEVAGELFQAERSLEHAETLAMALAGVGRFDQAADLQQQLIDQVGPDEDPRLLARLRQNLERYQRGPGS